MLTDLSIQLEKSNHRISKHLRSWQKDQDLFRNVTSFQLDLRSSITVTNEPGDLETEILYEEYEVRRVRKFVWASLIFGLKKGVSFEVRLVFKVLLIWSLK